MSAIDILDHYRQLELDRQFMPIAIGNLVKEKPREKKRGTCLICGPTESIEFLGTFHAKKLKDKLCRKCWNRMDWEMANKFHYPNCLCSYCLVLPSIIKK